MIGQLPRALEVGGRLLPIRSDFRVVLRLFPMFQDPELSDEEKAYVACRKLYECEINDANFVEATKQAYWFIDGGDIIKDESEKAIIDWEKDERIMMPAISKTVGVVDVRNLPYMHWWSFLGAFCELGDGLFSTVLNLRKKQANGEKLEQWEKDYIIKHTEIINIISQEEKKAIEETNAFIKELLHEN